MVNKLLPCWSKLGLKDPSLTTPVKPLKVCLAGFVPCILIQHRFRLSFIQTEFKLKLEVKSTLCVLFCIVFCFLKKIVCKFMLYFIKIKRFCQEG